MSQKRKRVSFGDIGIVGFIVLHDLSEQKDGRWSENPSPAVQILVRSGYIDQVGDHFTLSKKGKETIELMLKVHEKKDVIERVLRSVKEAEQKGDNVPRETVKGFFDV